MRALAAVAGALAMLLAGCVTSPSPSGGEPAFDATSIELTIVPAVGSFGGTVEVGWRVLHHSPGELGATGVAYGPSPLADPVNLTLADAEYRVSPPKPWPAPGSFRARVPLNWSIVHARAFAELAGVLYWSRELAIPAAGAPHGQPELDLYAPAGAEAGTPLNVTVRLANITGGVVTLAYGPFRSTAAVNASVREIVRPILFPWPAAWTLRAWLNVSGETILPTATRVAVREPTEPNVMLVGAPSAVAPAQDLVVRFRANGQGTLAGARLELREGENTTVVDAEVAGNRNFTARLAAPAAGEFALVAVVTTEGREVESAPAPVRVVPALGGAYSIRLVEYANSTVVGGAISVKARVVGPVGNSTLLLLHSGNRTVAGPAPSPADYGGDTVRPDGYEPGGPYRLPGTFVLTLPALPSEGVLYFRAKLEVGGLVYWSQEGAAAVRRP